MYNLLYKYRMYDYLYMNTTIAKVLQVVMDEGSVNSESVSRHFELASGHIQEILRNLHKSNLLYISSYKPDKRNCLRPMYSIGNKIDAEKPPVKYATERRKERLLAAKQPFTPRRDVASVWMTHL